MTLRPRTRTNPLCAYMQATTACKPYLLSELLGQAPVARAKRGLRLLEKGVACARVALGVGANFGVESGCE